MELWAILQGTQLCLPMGMKKLVVETDCLIAVQALDASPDSYACCCHLLHEIISHKACLEECKFTYVSSWGNRVAHFLARYAHNVENTTVWWDSLPNFISSATLLDSNCITWCLIIFSLINYHLSLKKKEMGWNFNKISLFLLKHISTQMGGIGRCFAEGQSGLVG